MADLNQLKQAVSAGNRNETKRLVQEAIAENQQTRAILDAMVAAMDEVGAKFQCNEIFVPEMLTAARAMKEGMQLLEPMLAKAGIKPAFTAVIGTVQGDLHDIGKNLVAMMWRGANFAVVDLGTNVPAEKFIATIQESKPAVVGLSALLTTTLPAMRETVKQIRSCGTDVKVIIGGAPVTQKFADEIGADGYAADAASAVEAVRNLISA